MLGRINPAFPKRHIKGTSQFHQLTYLPQVLGVLAHLKGFCFYLPNSVCRDSTVVAKKMGIFGTGGAAPFCCLGPEQGILENRGVLRIERAKHCALDLGIICQVSYGLQNTLWITCNSKIFLGLWLFLFHSIAYGLLMTPIFWYLNNQHWGKSLW